HHEQNGDLSECVEGAVGQQDAGNNVRRAKFLRDASDITFRQGPQRLLFGIADGKTCKDKPERGNGNDDGEAPDHKLPPAFRCASRTASISVSPAIGMRMPCAARASACEETGFVIRTK